MNKGLGAMANTDGSLQAQSLESEIGGNLFSVPFLIQPLWRWVLKVGSGIFCR